LPRLQSSKAYAPTSAAKNEEIDTFYEQLQLIIYGRHDIIAFAGDFNVKIRRESDTWKGIVGKFGWGDLIDSREELPKFCTTNGKIIKGFLPVPEMSLYTEDRRG